MITTFLSFTSPPSTGPKVCALTVRPPCTPQISRLSISPSPDYIISPPLSLPHSFSAKLTNSTSTHVRRDTSWTACMRASSLTLVGVLVECEGKHCTPFPSLLFFPTSVGVPVFAVSFFPYSFACLFLLTHSQALQSHFPKEERLYIRLE